MARDRGSHVRDDGIAKITYATRDEAARAANVLWARDGTPRNPYMCDQGPEHWHIGKGVADLANHNQLRRETR